MVKVGLLVAILAAAPQLAAAAPAKLKVAVVPGLAVNLDTGRVDALGQDLAEALSAQLEVDAIGGLDVRRALPTDGLPPDCATKPACTADVAKRTGASQLLFVVMVGSGGSVQLDLTWVDPATGKTAARPAIALASTSDSDAREKFEAAAPQLLPDAPVRPKQTSTMAVTGLATTPATPRHFTTASLATGGAAVAGLGVGIAFGLITRSKYDACSHDVACSAHTDDPRRGTIRTDAAIADAGFVVATGAAIATAVMWATSGESPHVMVAPSPEGGVTLTAVGRF